VAAGLTTLDRVEAMRAEAGELLAIFIASRHTARENLEREKVAAHRPSASYKIPD
jgi:hypothetical protein